MPRYIDAKKMEEWVRKEFATSPDFIVPWLIRMIRKQPTVDIRQARRGEWGLDWAGNGWCSECHHCGFVRGEEDVPDYCPNCGAEMALSPADRRKLE